MIEQYFRAPWGRVLYLMTVIGVVALGSVLVVVFWTLQNDEVPAWVPWLVLGLPLCVIAGTALFCVRGYTLLPGELRIKRLLWDTHLSLVQLREVTCDPEATRGSIRLMGNGGLFAFTGWFRNKRLGVYRAFLTDPKRAVVLRFPNRTVVVSPDSPEAFVTALKKAD